MEIRVPYDAHPMKISFSGDKSIGDILGSHFFKIPRFQRPYSWDRENVEDFWTDALQSPEADYFIGSMVVYKEAENMFGVVDGQQRRFPREMDNVMRTI